MAFCEIDVASLCFNPFTKIGKEWMLITAGDDQNHNTMTASWGGVGHLWNREVATTYIREQRYTKQFVDANDTFTLCFFDQQYRDALTLLGRKSGRDGDKIGESGLHTFGLDGTTAFEEASLILVCRKLYHQQLECACFDDKALDLECNPDRTCHTMYISEIVKVLARE